MKKTIKTRVETLQILTGSSICLFSSLRDIPYKTRRQLAKRLKLMNKETLSLRKEIVGY